MKNMDVIHALQIIFVTMDVNLSINLSMVTMELTLVSSVINIKSLINIFLRTWEKFYAFTPIKTNKS